jgi:hypothetical protein
VGLVRALLNRTILSQIVKVVRSLMNQPKHLVYEYAGNICPSDVREDLAGNFDVPEPGSIIVHNGRWWKVLDAIREGPIRGVAVYRVILGRSVGQGRV